MPNDLKTAVLALVDRLVLQASEDSLFRAELRQLAQAVLEATEEPKQVASVQPDTPALDAILITADDSPSVVGEAGQIEVRVPSASLRLDLPVVPPSPLPELTLGRSVPPIETATSSAPAAWFEEESADIPLIVARCHLKAEGARWAATRCRLLAEGATFSTEIEPKDRDIITRAKAIKDCFLWMCHSTSPLPADLTQFDDIAGCFDAMAEALSLLKQIDDDPDLNQGNFEQTLDLLAEAQSALRVAIDTIGGRLDNDQIQVHEWIKTTSREKQIFIQRYMRADDLADPTKWAELSARIDAVDSRIQKARQQGKQRKRLLGKIRHKLSVITSDPQAVDWQGVIDAVEELLDGGMPATNRELRGLLTPAIDSLPDIPDLPKEFQLVVREIDRFLATSPPTSTSKTTTFNAEVEKVARLLKGKTVVLIGGDCRQHSKEALKTAFKLNDLIWIETREHESLDGFKPIVSRSDVAVVLLAIRWSSHSYGEIKDQCDRTGKPLVRLPAGYSTNQVASQILQQCSTQLEPTQSVVR